MTTKGSRQSDKRDPGPRGDKVEVVKGSQQRRKSADKSYRVLFHVLGGGMRVDRNNRMRSTVAVRQASKQLEESRELQWLDDTRNTGERVGQCFLDGGCFWKCIQIWLETWSWIARKVDRQEFTSGGLTVEAEKLLQYGQNDA